MNEIEQNKQPIPKRKLKQILIEDSRVVFREETQLGKVEISIVPFAHWREGISELWSHLPSVDSISPFDNAHGIIDYSGSKIFERMICFPLEMTLNNRPIGWVSTYNISETAIRIRGLYVKPEFRGSGLGFKMCDVAVAMWPEKFLRCYGLWRDSAFPVLERKWGLIQVPGYVPRPISLYNPKTKTFEPAKYKVIYAYKNL